MRAGQYLWAAVIVALMAGVALPAGADDAPVPQKPRQSAPKSLSINVTSATYGHSTMRTSCIVTPVVKRSCNGRSRCVVKADDDLCRPPSIIPAGLILTLTVEYQCAPLVVQHIAHADKPFQILIDCGGAAAQSSPKVGSTP